MTIKNSDKFVASLWDWGCLDGCFGDSKIAVTDVDGLLEHNGQFLLMETKGPEVEIPLGQQIMFNHLIEKPGFHVLVIWGEPGKPQELQFWGRRKYTADLAGLRRVVKRWYEFSSS